MIFRNIHFFENTIIPFQPQKFFWRFRGKSLNANNLKSLGIKLNETWTWNKMFIIIIIIIVLNSHTDLFFQRMFSILDQKSSSTVIRGSMQKERMISHFFRAFDVIPKTSINIVNRAFDLLNPWKKNISQK